MASGQLSDGQLTRTTGVQRGTEADNSGPANTQLRLINYLFDQSLQIWPPLWPLVLVTNLAGNSLASASVVETLVMLHQSYLAQAFVTVIARQDKFGHQMLPHTLVANKWPSDGAAWA